MRCTRAAHQTSQVPSAKAITMPIHHCTTSFTGNGAGPDATAAGASSETTRRLGMSERAPEDIRPILLEFVGSEHFFIVLVVPMGVEQRNAQACTITAGQTYSRVVSDKPVC